MGDIPFYLFYSLSFLESMAVFYFLFAFNRIKTSIGVFFVIVAIYPLIVMLMRKLPISFGMHTILLIVFISMFISLYFKESFYLSLMSAVILFAILISLEHLMIKIFLYVLKIDTLTYMQNNIYWFLSGLPHILIILLIGHIIKIYRGKNEN